LRVFLQQIHVSARQSLVSVIVRFQYSSAQWRSKGGQRALGPGRHFVDQKLILKRV